MPINPMHEVRAGHHIAPSLQEALQLMAAAFASGGYNFRTQELHLFRQQRYVLAGAEPRDAEFIGIARNDAQCIAAYRPRGSQYGDSFHFRSTILADLSPYCTLSISFMQSCEKLKAHRRAAKDAEIAENKFRDHDLLF